VSLLAATNFLQVTKILHNSHYSHRKELHLIHWLHHSRNLPFRVILTPSNQTSLLIYIGLQGNSQWTLCLKLHIFVLFHILSIKLYYLLRWVTYGLEMWALFFNWEHFEKNTHTHETWTAFTCKSGEMFIMLNIWWTELSRANMLHNMKHKEICPGSEIYTKQL
jgi:hypothetical protein